jgi:integrase
MTNLHDQHGHRKYLTPAERDAFLRAADDAEVREVRSFCATLAYTGCRISEALALTAHRIDLKDGTIVIESAKKRQTGIYRPISVPPALLDMLNLVHDIRAAHKRRDRGETVVNDTPGPHHWPAAAARCANKHPDRICFKRTATPRTACG